MTRILITRPQAQAEAFANELTFRGYDVFIEPLLKIQEHILPRPQMPSIDAVVITSTNALTFLENRRSEIADLLKLPCYCVGAKTSTVALSFGFQHLFEGPSDSVELAKRIQKDIQPGKYLLHPCTAEMPTSIGQILLAQGYKIQEWPTYKTEEAPKLTQELQQALTNGLIDIALFFSPRTATVFCKLVVAQGISPCCQKLTAIGLSQMVTTRLSSLQWQNLKTATFPNEDAMMDCLFQTRPVL